jgi:hypothetical protein
MRRLFWCFVVLFVFGIGTSVACENCYLTGSTSPKGNIVRKTTCWTESSGLYQSCYVLADYSDCQMDDVDPTACPEKTGDGGGSGGGGGGGSIDCQRTSSGSCPPECMSCPPLF